VCESVGLFITYRSARANKDHHCIFRLQTTSVLPERVSLAQRVGLVAGAGCVEVCVGALTCGLRNPGSLVGRMFPRRKAGEECRAGPDHVAVTKETLSQFFDRPLRQAAIDLGISPSALKSMCRKLKVDHPRLRCAVCSSPAHDARARWMPWRIGQKASTMSLTPARAWMRWIGQEASRERVCCLLVLLQ
jgi:hypothetical protein